MTDQAEFGFHTEGRRQPMLIGKDASGKKIWGGPYSVWQLLGLIVVVPLTWSTQSMWGAQWTMLGRLLVTAAVGAATVYGIGRINFAGRNPFLMAAGVTSGLIGTLTAPAGRLNGRPITTAKPRRRHPTHQPRHTLVRVRVTPLLALEAGPSATPTTHNPDDAGGPTPRATGTVVDPPTPDTTTPPATVPPTPTPTRQSPLEAFLAAAPRKD